VTGPVATRGILRRAALGCACLAALAVATPAQAAGGNTLGEIGAAANWTGSIANSVAVLPAGCTPLTCDTYEVNVKLPPGAWDDRPGGLQVSLRWPASQLDAGYDLDLYLYGPDGELVSDGSNLIYSVSEGAWAQDPKNGTYRIVVVPRDVVGKINYDLVAHLERGWSVKTTASLLGLGDLASDLTPYQPTLVFAGHRPERNRVLLPDLKAVKPRNFHIESTLAVNFYQASQRVPPHQPSCYPQETLGLDADELGSQDYVPIRCLRWDLAVDNVGRGPWEVRAYPNSATPESAFQALYRTDGTYRLAKVGQARFSNAHGHIHFRGNDEVGLYKLNPDGSRGKLVKEMGDKGICAIDLINRSFGTAADIPSKYVVPGTCDVDDNIDSEDPLYPGERYLRTGISAGWRDVYPWFIPDQYIDITDVADGKYLLVYHVNASGLLHESSFANNSSRECVEFHGTDVAPC
jgi:lysyl oxidase